jgi:glycosyltransferase involved in cell wall biosynthesis
MRIAVLWAGLSGYLNACLRELAALHGVELFLAHFVKSKEAPYEDKIFNWVNNRYEISYEDKKKIKGELLKRLMAFGPDAILVSSWHIQAYRYVLRKLAGGPVRILCMDNPWRGTIKQYLGVINSSWYLLPLYDAVFVPGERQAVFAKKLSFKEANILYGLLSCDHSSFASVYLNRLETKVLPRVFIYVGRFSREKGVGVLAQAYREYRDRVRDPWPLICCGAGELETALSTLEGVEFKRFVQPDDLPAQFAAASCLILSSTFEPWGLVIHEAGAAGLAIICSSICGAAVHLVQDGYNGFLVEAGNVTDLARAMKRYTHLSEARRQEMARNSHNLSQQFTPRRWAVTLCEKVNELRHKEG